MDYFKQRVDEVKASDPGEASVSFDCADEEFMFLTTYDVAKCDEDDTAEDVDSENYDFGKCIAEKTYFFKVTGGPNLET